MKVALLLIFSLTIALGVGLPATEVKPWVYCSVGYTGANCDNPICYNETELIPHDGTKDGGDLIAWQLVFDCNGEVPFYLDEFVNSITIIVTPFNNGSAALFTGSYSDRYVWPSSSTNYPNRTSVAYYDRLAERIGYQKYTLKISSGAPIQNCEVSVFAPTTMSIDGGFVWDSRDDRVQVGSQPYPAVGRNPLLNGNSVFAFNVPSILRYPGKPTDVTTYAMPGSEVTGPVKERYGCSASAYAGMFSCKVLNTIMHIKIKGIDTKGNIWERVYTYYCTEQM